MKNSITVLALCLLCACSGPVKYEQNVLEKLQELDDAIAHKGIYEQEKEQRIEGVRGMLRGANTPESLYAVYNRLFEEYSNYNLDSVMVYARRKLALADSVGLPALQAGALLDMADIYRMTGMYVETKDLMSSIQPETLDSCLLERYYNTYHNLYRDMSSICVSPQLKEVYDQATDRLQVERLRLLPAGNMNRLFVEAEQMRKEGLHQEVIDMLIKPLDDPGTTTHEKAILAYIIARSYQKMEKPDEAICYFAVSSICDIHTPVHEHAALYKLASLLYEVGDVERAYRYINCSMNDAFQVSARTNIYYINQRLPLISRSYDAQMQQQKRKLINAIAGISLLLGLLAVAVVMVYTSLKRTSAARLAQNRMYEELKVANAELVEVNRSLKESNNIKEAYMGRYLDMCSNYINGVEEYRLHLNNIMRKDGGNEVLKTIKTSTYMKEELEEFYSSFDATFLHIFPHFVEQFNRLLQDDKQIVLKQGELLNTELRVFALIRLGITDSVKIAEFLRRSTSTIYNYRVKMRNAAINSRQDFEKQVISIGSLS